MWSSFTHSTNLKGPVPTGFSLGSADSIAFLFTTSRTAARDGISPPQLALVMMRTFVGLTTSTPSVGARKTAFAAPSFLSKRRSKVYLTSAAENLSPLWNQALSTRSNSQVVGLTCRQLF